ncbi:hypothetical protein L1887_22636 [Cichorium endivia]|nr:hypothetical protein L1887_22636 [Cichorium endivia]
MEDDRRVGDLVGELVYRLQSDSSSPHSNSNPNPNSEDVKYAIRILSSRMTPLVVANEAAMANSIKSQMAKQGKLSDALSFADLYSRFASKTGPGSVKNKRAVLYLLKVISEDRSSNPKFQTDRSFTDLDTNENRSTDLKDNSRSWNDNLRALRDQNSRKLKNGGVLFISRDPDDMRDMAYREFATLVNMENDVSEEVLVSDVLSVCQGIDGKYVKFDVNADGYVLPNSIKVPKATRIMIRKLCELGWLYQKVIGYISENLDGFSSENVGKVAKAFCSALQDELFGYDKLLTVLQSHDLSLRRLSVWLVEPMVKMRRMAVLVDSCRSLKGGAMAGAIHLHAQHGDPLLHDFMKQLLQKLSSPLFEMVRSWVLEGDLQDSYSEFFISEQSVKPESLWREGYKVNHLMLPSFISKSLAHQILRTGKSINFLKVCCNDHSWAELSTEAVSATWTNPKRRGLGYGETNALESLVTESSKRIDKHLMDVIFNQYKFKEHCLAIKHYILLGQGDFVQYLMEVIEPVLMEPANTISLLHLSGLLQKSILSSSAQYDNRDILDRLTVKMMPHGTGRIKDIGWDVFSLDYDPRVPLNTIFTQSAMGNYLKIFNFLWKIRRVEHGILRSWKAMKPNLSTSLLSKLPKGVKFQVVLRRCQVLWGQMSHFLTNLQSYVMFEVLEVSWDKFCNEMKASKDLDDLIDAHDKYLSSIIEKSLLGESCKDLIKTLLKLFDVILRFTSVLDRFYEGINEFGSSKSKMKKGKGLKSKGLETDSWVNEGRKAVTQRAGEFLKNMGRDFDEISKEYLLLLKGFICQLPMQQHVDLKFLLFRLDFTEVYN